MRPIKLGIAGTHSTGKSTFLQTLAARLDGRARIGLVDDLARRARDLGFPILTNHTYESTLWIMAEGMRQEAELSLSCDVILIDRPTFDALAYLNAALSQTGRALATHRLESLTGIARAHVQSYDLLITTALDRAIPLGEGRDANAEFREAAATEVNRFIRSWELNSLTLTSSNIDEVLEIASCFVIQRLEAQIATQP